MKEDSEEEDVAVLKPRRKKKKTKKATKSRELSHGKKYLPSTDELGKILSLSAPIAYPTSSKKRHVSGNTPKLSSVASSQASNNLVAELSAIYEGIRREYTRQFRQTDAKSINEQQDLEKDNFLKIRAKLYVYPMKNSISICDFARVLEHKRELFNKSLGWLSENECNDSSCSPLLTVTRQLSRLSSPSLSQQTSVQLFSASGSFGCNFNEVSCPKLLQNKVDEIQSAYRGIKGKIDSFYDELSSLYSSSMSWMDLTFFKWRDEERNDFKKKVFESRPALHTEDTIDEASLGVTISQYPKLSAIMTNLESINSWCYFTYAAFETLFILGKLISNSDSTAFPIANPQNLSSKPDEVKPFESEPFDLDSQVKLFAETNADYASILQFESWHPEDPPEKFKGPLMIVKSKLHVLLLKMRDALIVEVGSDKDFRFNLQHDHTRVEVLCDQSFSFFDFTEFADSVHNKQLAIFDKKYLFEVCHDLPEKTKSIPENYSPPRDLPSLLYLYVYLLRLERSICAYQIHDLKRKLGLDENPAYACDRMEPENKVRSLVNIILIAVSEKVYISKLIMPFIGNLEFESHIESDQSPNLQRPDLFTETYQYELLLREAFADYSSYFYQNFTNRSTSMTFPSVSPQGSPQTSTEDDTDGLLLFDKSFAIYHWRFTCKVLPYIGGGCHQSVDAFRRAVKFYLDQISTDLNIIKQKFEILVENEEWRENPWEGVIKLHTQLKSYQLCLRNVTIFTRQVLADLSICSVCKVQNVEKFFRSIKYSHILVEIHEKYLNPSEFETSDKNQPACYLIDRKLTENLDLLKDLLLAIVNNKGRNSENFGFDLNRELHSASSSEKSDSLKSKMANKIQCPMPSLTALDSQHYYNIPKLSSTLKSTPEVGSLAQHERMQEELTPSITPFGMNILSSNTDTLNSKNSSSPEQNYNNPDAYLLVLSPSHINTWNQMFENDKGEKLPSKITVLPPFYSFLPELTSMECPQQETTPCMADSTHGSLFDLTTEQDSCFTRSKSEDVLDTDELLVVSFSNAVAASVINSQEFKQVSLKASQVPRYKSTRHEFESLYSTSGSSTYVGPDPSPGIGLLDEDDVGSSSAGSGTMENVCDGLDSMNLDRPILISLFEELVEHLELSVSKVGEYMEKYKNRNKSPSSATSSSSKHFMAGSKLIVPCTKYLYILSVMAMQYARDLSFIVTPSDQSHPKSKPRAQFSSLCLNLAHILIKYMLTVLKASAGLNSKPSTFVTAYLKFIAQDSISSLFSAEEKEQLKDGARKMFYSIYDQHSSVKLSTSRSTNSFEQTKRSRRDVRKTKSEIRSGIHFHNGAAPFENFYDATDSVDFLAQHSNNNTVNGAQLRSNDASFDSVSSLSIDENGVVDHGDVDLDDEKQSLSSSSDDAKNMQLDSFMRKLDYNMKTRQQNLLEAINKRESEMVSRKVEFTGKVLSDSTPRKDNIASRIIGIYVNFEFRTGRYLPKSAKRVSEAIKAGSDLTMAVKDICFDDRYLSKQEPLHRDEVKDYVDSLRGRAKEQFESNIKEVEQLMKLQQCQYVVTFYGVAIGKGFIYICMELFEQSLKTLATTAHEMDQFSPVDFRAIFHQVVQALKYIHSRNRIHMDIKAENIFLKELSGRGHNFYLAKLGDFGLTVKQGSGGHCTGTPGFVAMELFENSANISTKCDIWSLGCTVLQVFCNVHNPMRRLAFDDENIGVDLLEPEIAMRLYFSRQIHLPMIDVKKGVTNDCVNFMEKCLRLDPDERPTAAQLSSHPFVC